MPKILDHVAAEEDIPTPSEVLAAMVTEDLGEFIKVFDLHISDVILVQKRTGFSPQIIAQIERNPRGCKGRTHVKIQNGPTECYENIARIHIQTRELPETD